MSEPDQVSMLGTLACSQAGIDTDPGCYEVMFACQDCSDLSFTSKRPRDWALCCCLVLGAISLSQQHGQRHEEQPADCSHACVTAIQKAFMGVRWYWQGC